MSVLVLLIVFSLIVAIIFLVAFLISVKSGQYDDTETPSIRMLFEDKPKEPHANTGKSDSNQHQDVV